jgi:hypothetical protein
MTGVKDLTLDDLEQFIEQKILEVLGDPDSGLDLKQEFKQELTRRLKSRSRRIPHHEVAGKIGKD